ncbi:MAG: cell wall-binding repeat-containing protein [Gracilibacteraceae bacterium]|jgi:putative cell wall-binding protein|nr:cell wall-binding repeat-containing protein [Gracilibacteraceae bacterium]
MSKKMRGAILGAAFFFMAIALAAPAPAAAANIAANISLERLAGADRYQTAARIAQAGWESAENVVLASGADASLVDALAVAPLAKLLGAPILITESSRLSEAAAAELRRLGARNVYLAGGSGVIGQPVVDAVVAMGARAIPLGGADRFATAANIAAEIARRSESISTVVVTTAYSNADALSIASIAAANGWPILLAGRDALPAAARSFINEHGVSQAYVIGGHGAVGDAVFTSLPDPVRLGGGDRYATNLAVLRFFADRLNYSRGLFIASGANNHLVDALTSSAYIAGAPLVLTDNAAILPDTASFIKSSMAGKRELLTVTGLGGAAAASEEILYSVLVSLGGTPPRDPALPPVIGGGGGGGGGGGSGSGNPQNVLRSLEFTTANTALLTLTAARAGLNLGDVVAFTGPDAPVRPLPIKSVAGLNPNSKSNSSYILTFEEPVENTHWVEIRTTAASGLGNSVLTTRYTNQQTAIVSSLPEILEAQNIGSGYSAVVVDSPLTIFNETLNVRSPVAIVFEKPVEVAGGGVISTGSSVVFDDGLSIETGSRVSILEGGVIRADNLENKGTLTLAARGALHVSGELTVSGVLENNGEVNAPGRLVVAAGGRTGGNGVITAQDIDVAGEARIGGAGSLTALGTLTVDGSLDVLGTLNLNRGTVAAGASLTAAGVTVVDGDLTVNGIFRAERDAFLTINGHLRAATGATAMLGGEIRTAAGGALSLSGAGARITGHLTVAAEGVLNDNRIDAANNYWEWLDGDEARITLEGGCQASQGALTYTGAAAALINLEPGASLDLAVNSVKLAGTGVVRENMSVNADETLTIAPFGKLSVAAGKSVAGAGNVLAEKNARVALAAGASVSSLSLSSGAVYYWDSAVWHSLGEVADNIFSALRGNGVDFITAGGEISAMEVNGRDVAVIKHLYLSGDLALSVSNPGRLIVQENVVLTINTDDALRLVNGGHVQTLGELEEYSPVRGDGQIEVGTSGVLKNYAGVNLWGDPDVTVLLQADAAMFEGDELYLAGRESVSGLGLPRFQLSATSTLTLEQDRYIFASGGAGGQSVVNGDFALEKHLLVEADAGLEIKGALVLPAGYDADIAADLAISGSLTVQRPVSGNPTLTVNRGGVLRSGVSGTGWDLWLDGASFVCAGGSRLFMGENHLVGFNSEEQDEYGYLSVGSGALTVNEADWLIDGTVIVNDGTGFPVPRPVFSTDCDVEMVNGAVLQVNGRLLIDNINLQGNGGRIIVSDGGEVEIGSGAMIEFTPAEEKLWIEGESHDQEDITERGKLIINAGAALSPDIPAGEYVWNGFDWERV